MRENSDNKKITPSEKRKKSLFYAVAEGEKDIGTLADMLSVSRSTVRRYARELESAGIVRFMISNAKEGRKVKRIGLCPKLCFAIVKIGERTTELSTVMFLPKYEYSVTLPYNEALTETENTLCVKRNLEKLCEQALAYKTLVGVMLDDGACIAPRVCREMFGGTAISVIECMTSKSFMIDALVLNAIRNVHNKK